MTRSRLVLPLYLGAEGLSFLGNAMVGLLLPWLVIARTGDPAAAALVAAAAAITQVAATAASGPLIDRVGAKPLAVLADLGSTASVIALLVVDLLFGLTLPWMLALAVAGAVFDVPGMTARQTLMPRVAERSGASLDTTSAARQSVFGLSFLLGPAAAGMLLAGLGTATALMITGACTLLAAGATLAIRVPRIVAAPDDLGLRGVWRTIRGTRVIVRLLVVAAMSSFVTAPLLSVLLPAHFAEADRPDLLGYVSSAFAFGILGGSLLYAVVTRISRRFAWTVAILLMTAGLGTLGFLGPFGALATAAVVVGVGSGLVNPMFAVVVAERVPPGQLGRVMALANVAGLASGPAGLGLAALILTGGSLQSLAWAITIGWVAVAALSLFGPSLRDLESPGGTGTPPVDKAPAHRAD
ncbi:MFS transporter [Microbacterium sp. 18062]|uniref:MFS transporter n=1 Tax=Microbacterium sp. 18062 TaxID=2681410 RepID=UPI00135CA29F|nr:MFS transporter [Microbacterium sp. 18062]